MVRQWQQAFYGERYSASNMQTGMPDFELLAQAFGVKGMVVCDRERLPEAITEMLAHNGPVLLDAQVTKDENCYPMVTPGKSNAQMVGLPERPQKQANTIVTCSYCGTQSPATHNFCPACGNKF
jgi:acetolactate synthase-1/2/3 large subunit